MSPEDRALLRKAQEVSIALAVFIILAIVIFVEVFTGNFTSWWVARVATAVVYAGGLAWLLNRVLRVLKELEERIDRQ